MKYIKLDPGEWVINIINKYLEKFILVSGWVSLASKKEGDSSG